MLSPIFRGLRRAADPKLLVLLWLANTLVALPGALAIGEAIRNDVGASRFHKTLDEGFDMEWMAEYSHRNGTGFPALFAPQRTGAGAVYENLDAWFGGRLLSENRALAGVLIAFGLVWILLQGGVVARLVGPPRAAFSLRGFFADAGGYFVRFLVLGLMSAFVYWVLYRLGGWAFGLVDASFQDAGTERELIHRVLFLGTAFVILLHATRMVFDYAKIATVVEGTRLAPVAVWQGMRFVANRPARTLSVYFAVALMSLAFLWLYTLVAPGPGQSGAASLLFAFVLSQLFVAGRLFLRLALLGAQAEVYQDAGGL